MLNIEPYNCQEYEKHAQCLIKDYDDREKRKRHEFFGWQTAILVAGVTVTIINSVPLGNDPWVRVISSIFGAAVVVITGLTQLLKSRELWVYFGVTYVRLDSEYKLYKGESGIYANKNPKERCQLFIERFEGLRLQAATESWAIAAKAHENNNSR
jgi:hypothetical protein